MIALSPENSATSYKYMNQMRGPLTITVSTPPSPNIPFQQEGCSGIWVNHENTPSGNTQ